MTIRKPGPGLLSDVSFSRATAVSAAVDGCSVFGV